MAAILPVATSIHSMAPVALSVTFPPVTVLLTASVPPTPLDVRLTFPPPPAVTVSVTVSVPPPVTVMFPFVRGHVRQLCCPRPQRQGRRAEVAERDIPPMRRPTVFLAAKSVTLFVALFSVMSPAVVVAANCVAAILPVATDSLMAPVALSVMFASVTVLLIASVPPTPLDVRLTFPPPPAVTVSVTVSVPPLVIVMSPFVVVTFDRAVTEPSVRAPAPELLNVMFPDAASVSLAAKSTTLFAALFSVMSAVVVVAANCVAAILPVATDSLMAPVALNVTFAPVTVLLIASVPPAPLDVRLTFPPPPAVTVSVTVSVPPLVIVMSPFVVVTFDSAATEPSVSAAAPESLNVMFPDTASVSLAANLATSFVALFSVMPPTPAAARFVATLSDPEALDFLSRCCCP